MSTVIRFETPVLRRLLANASLFASKDDTLPALCAVRFHFDGDRLLVVGTNRYMLSYETADVLELSGSDPFSVAIQDVKQLVQMLPRGRGRNETTVIYDAVDETVTFDTPGAARISFDVPVGEFPKVNLLIDKFAGGERPVVKIAAGWLAALAKVDGGDKYTPVVFELPGKGELVRVSVGDKFKAIVVAIRDPAPTPAG